MISIDAIEAFYILVNAVAVVLTTAALLDARADRAALNNGPVRTIIANGNVRREAIRLGVQLLLMIIAIPAIFTARETQLSPIVLVLLAIPLFLLASSILDRRDRGRLRILTLGDLSSDHQRLFDQGVLTGEKADHAYSEANAVNLKIAALQKSLLKERNERKAADKGVAGE